MKKHRPALWGEIALRPEDAAATLSISLSSLNRLVAEGKIRRPVRVPGMNIVLYDRHKLMADWQVLQDNCSSEGINPWDVS
jgi:hypothetical protein